MRRISGRRWPLHAIGASLVFTSICLACAGPAEDREVAAPAATAKAVQAEVVTQQGLIAGLPSPDAPAVMTWKGIPYAAPPVGDLRWKAPAPPPAWKGVRETKAYSHACLQPDGVPGSFYGGAPLDRDENCLFLNVWSAAKSSDEARPVMVWIHGGGLVNGSGSSPWYEGSALAQKGVVLVTINYRLGPMGFMAHQALTAEASPSSSGNYGILDQIAALQWVRDNIAAFGGDPGNVTIFGESAGSWSICYLQATPLARGLFHRAIGESGGVFGPMPRLAAATAAPAGRGSAGGDFEPAEATGVRLAKALGLEGEATADALRAKTPQEIYDALAKVNRTGPAEGQPALWFRPNVDGWVYPLEIYDLFATHEHNDVPLLLGSNANEGTALWGATAPTTVAAYRKAVETRYRDFAHDILAAYPAAADADAKAAFLELQGDDVFAWQMRTWARLATASGKEPAYLYFFSRVPPGPEAATYGSYHAAEIVYAFDHLTKGKPHTWEAADEALAHTMSAYWVSFAKDGNPNEEGLPPWPRYDAATDQALELGDNVRVLDALKRDRLDLLDRFYESERAAAAGAEVSDPKQAPSAASSGR